MKKFFVRLKFRESNVFAKEITKHFLVRVNFSFFHNNVPLLFQDIWPKLYDNKFQLTARIYALAGNDIES